MSDPLDPQLIALGRALADLAPAPPTLDRDRIVYEAGLAAARPWPLGWATAAAFAVIAVTSWTRPEPQSVREINVVTRIVPTATESTDAAVPSVAVPDSGAVYLRLRNQVVSWGADVLPARLPPGAAVVAPSDVRWKPTTAVRGDI